MVGTAVVLVAEFGSNPFPACANGTVLRDAFGRLIVVADTGREGGNFPAVGGAYDDRLGFKEAAATVWTVVTLALSEFKSSAFARKFVEIVVSDEAAAVV
jgi:hypothetical protein